MALSQEGVVRAPRHLDAVQAAALPCAAVTAWNALVSQGGIKAGDVVLVQGTGGVSLFALLFAKMHGARVLATSSSDEKLERVRAMGADHVVNYKTNPDWHKVAREITNGTGVDLVVEVAGTLDTSIRAVRASGTVALIGVLAGAAAQLNLGPVVTQNIRLQGVTVGSREAFEEMVRAMELHRTEPPVDAAALRLRSRGRGNQGPAGRPALRQGLQPVLTRAEDQRATARTVARRRGHHPDRELHGPVATVTPGSGEDRVVADDRASTAALHRAASVRMIPVLSGEGAWKEPPRGGISASERAVSNRRLPVQCGCPDWARHFPGLFDPDAPRRLSAARGSESATDQGFAEARPSHECAGARARREPSRSRAGALSELARPLCGGENRRRPADRVVWPFLNG